MKEGKRNYSKLIYSITVKHIQTTTSRLRRGDVLTQIAKDNGKRPFGGGWVFHMRVILW